MSCTLTVLWGLLVFEPLHPMLFSLHVVFALQSVALRLGYLLTQSEYVNLRPTLCTSALFSFEDLNERY